MSAVDDLGAILKQRTWDKEVVLWLGSDADLRDAVAGMKVVELDLLDLFDENRLPVDEDEARRELVPALRARLRKLDGTSSNRLVLIVRSAGLLARYAIGLREFYDWFCGDFGLVIIPMVLGGANTAWPESVAMERDRLFGYFTSAGMCSRVLGTRVEA